MLREFLCGSKTRFRIFRCVQLRVAHTFLYEGLKNEELGSTTQERREKISVMGYNMTLAAVKAVKLCHEIDPKNLMGCVFGLHPCYPLTTDPSDNLYAYRETIRDFYQVDAMCYGAFPKYKLSEYKKLGIDIGYKEEDAICFRALLILSALIIITVKLLQLTKN